MVLADSEGSWEEKADGQETTSMWCTHTSHFFTFLYRCYTHASHFFTFLYRCYTRASHFFTFLYRCYTRASHFFTFLYRCYTRALHFFTFLYRCYTRASHFFTFLYCCYTHASHFLLWAAVSLLRCDAVGSCFLLFSRNSIIQRPLLAAAACEFCQWSHLMTVITCVTAMMSKTGFVSVLCVCLHTKKNCKTAHQKFRNNIRLTTDIVCLNKHLRDRQDMLGEIVSTDSM